MGNLKRTLEKWQEWDTVSRIENHVAIKESLLELFRVHKAVRPFDKYLNASILIG
jgi:hypothetical protein